MAGQHTREIMERLGYEAAAIDALVERKVVYEPDENYSWPV